MTRRSTITGLLSSRIIAPRSNLKTWLDSSDKLNDPFKAIDLQHLYRTLDFVYAYGDSLMKTVHEKLMSEKKRDCSVVFYDVTNAWFEAAYTDQERAEIAIARKIAALGHEPSQAEYEKILEAVEKKYPEMLRMRGFSKEHRNDCPLVSIALLMDGNQVPIDYKVYAGNTSEKNTMVDAIKDIGQEYAIKGTVVVADRGLNTYENIAQALDNGHGILVAQSVHQLPEETKNLIKSKIQWDTIGNTGIKIGEFSIDKEDHRPVKKDQKGAPIPCRLIVTWSAQRAARDLMKLQEDAQRAKLAIEAKTSMLKRSSSWEWLIEMPKKNDATKAMALDQEAYAEREALAGYYAIVYHDPTQGENTPKLTAQEIVEHYRRLVGIEECFRVMKTNMDLRPLYVRTPSHVRGAIGICVLALVLLRLLELRLREAGTPLTIEQIIEGLNDAKLVPIETKDGYCFQPLETRKVSSAEWKALQSATEDCPTPTPLIDQIMQACELTPIASMMTVPSLSKALRTRFDPSTELVPPDKKTRIRKLSREDLKS